MTTGNRREIPTRIRTVEQIQSILEQRGEKLTRSQILTAIRSAEKKLRTALAGESPDIAKGD